MTMNPDVFRSLLALDSYNRGYGANVVGLSEAGQIGDATIVSRTSIFGQNTDQVYASWQAAGFYAIAYEWNGQTVISYRGTNFPKEFTVEEVLDVIDKDIGEGWSIFTGLGPNSQPLLAQQFYKAVTGRDFLDSPGDPIGTGISSGDTIPN